ncbi:MAG: alpha/beta hydrolase [Anaerolineae bacterium]|nr:alpha/beta hydrolase [Anaerolineae bacterium]
MTQGPVISEVTGTTEGDLCAQPRTPDPQLPTPDLQPRTPDPGMRTWRYWVNLLLFALVTFVLILTAGLIYLARQRAWEYVHPRRAVRQAGDTPASYGVSYEEVAFTTPDGLVLRAWYTPSQNGVVVLVAHGHGGARPADAHSLFARNRYGVVSWDFRAHGESEGEICTLGYYEVLDVEAALDFALSQPGVKRVGAWGGSMGGATVIMAAARRSEIEAVVADSAYAALADELEVMVPFAPLRPLVRFFGEREAGISIHDVRPEEVIGRISPRPVLIIQGLADQMVPPDAGERLYSAAGTPKYLWVEPDVGHMEMMYRFPLQYEQRVIEFFDQALVSGR